MRLKDWSRADGVRMVESRQIVNTIVEGILRPNIDDPKTRERGNFIYSDSISFDDDSLKIGVSKNNKTGLEMKRLGSLEKYEQTRIQVDVQVPTGGSAEAFRQNHNFPDWVKKPEDAVDYLSGQVEDLVVEEADKDKEDSKIRDIGGSDEDVVLEYDQTTRVPLTNATLRDRVFFLAAHE